MDPEPVTALDDGWTVQSASMPASGVALQDADPVPAAAAPVDPTPPAVPDAAVVAEPLVPPPPVAAAPPPAAVNPAVQARIDKSIRAQREAERDRDAARYRAEQLERELTTLRAAAPPAPPPATPAPQAAAVPPPPATPPPVTTAAEPQWAEFEARGESWEDYQKAWRTWNHETTVAAATSAAQAAVKERLELAAKTDAVDRQKRDAEVRFQARLDAMRAKNPDYDQIVADGGTTALDPLNSAYLEHLILYTHEGAEILLDLVRDPAAAALLAEKQPTRAVVDAIGMSPAPRALLAHFAAHPDEMDSLIASSDPRTVFMTLGSLAARLTGARTPASPAAVPATPVRPAPPLRPVAGVSTTAGAGNPAPGDDVPFGPDYVRLGNRADAERRRGL